MFFNWFGLICIDVSGMEKLRKLELSGNQISRLEAQQFPELLHLQSLKLNGCNIRYIHNFAFVNLPNITTLVLSDNIMEAIQPAVFENNKKLLSLELRNNRWNCDCMLRPFAKWMASNFNKVRQMWNCFKPM